MVRLTNESAPPIAASGKLRAKRSTKVAVGRVQPDDEFVSEWNSAGR